MQNVVELLDELFHQAASANEPPELNYVRKHSQDMQAKVRLTCVCTSFVDETCQRGPRAQLRVQALSRHASQGAADMGVYFICWRDLHLSCP